MLIPLPLIVVLLSFGGLSIIMIPTSEQEVQPTGPVTFNATMTKNPEFSFGDDGLSFDVDLPSAFYFLDHPGINYTLSKPDDSLVVTISSDVFSLTGDFRVEQENATFPSTKYLSVSSSAPVDAKNYDKNSGTTTYNIELSFLTITEKTWNNTKSTVKTFDNGTGILSIHAEE